MYAKLFTSIYQGTLRGNSHGLLVFTNLLAHCDKSGMCDMHPRAIAEEVGLTVEQVRAALDELEAADAESRSPEEDGRRIKRMDEHRAWGWFVVNYAKYRAIRDEDDRREQNRLSQERWRERNRAKSAGVSHDKPPSGTVSHGKPESAHTEAEAEAEGIPSTLPRAPARPVVEAAGKETRHDCPHKQILELWAEVLPALPQHTPSLWKGARAEHLRARWRETADEKAWTSTDDGLAYFRKLFGFVGKSAFLTGRVKPRDDKPAFVCELAWLVMPQNWAKVLEGKYHQTEAA